MTKVELSKEEASLLTFLSKKKGPVYIMEQDVPALHGLHAKSFAAINGNVGAITDEGRIWLADNEDSKCPVCGDYHEKAELKKD